MEPLGSHSTARAATIAPCPHLKFLAAGPAARAHGGCGGGDSRVEILRLWRRPEEPEKGRQLEVVATIPAPGDRGFHRLAWSARDANYAYQLGLLAGSVDDGAVDQGGRAYPFTLSDFTSVYCWEESFSRSDQYDASLVSEKFKKGVQETASNMLLEFDDLIKDKFTAKDPKESNPNSEDDQGDCDGWELLPGRDEIDLEDLEVLPNKTDDGSTDALVFKVHDMIGNVLGLSFNNPYGNTLACGGLGEKIALYHLDCPIKTCVMVDISSREIDSQITFLDWHPEYPVLLASACDVSVAKIWDLRQNKAAYRFLQKNKGRCTEVLWNPKNPLQIAVGSTGTALDTVEIWDARNLRFPLVEFGPEKGIVSISWCAEPNTIFTTNVDGAADAWELHEIQGANPTWTLYNPPDRIPLHPAGKEEILWCRNEDVIAVSSSKDISLYKKPLTTVHFS